VHNKTWERRNQANVLLQVVTGTPTKLAAHASIIPTHATQGKYPLSTQHSLRKVSPSGTIKPWA